MKQEFDSPLTLTLSPTGERGLKVRVFQANPQPPKAAVILCHGFGAPGNDLVSLGPALAAQHPALRDVRFYFPAAPLSLGEMGWGDSRAWWLIDIDGLQRLQRSEASLREYCQLEPEGLAQARKALSALVHEVAAQTGLPFNRLVLGGFSQGAMLATDLALRLEEAPGALCILSGTLVNEPVWRKKAAARAGLPVFQSHGRQDAVLPFMAAQWLQQSLVEAGLQVEFVPFDAGHTISEDALMKLGGFLSRQLFQVDQ